MISYGKRQVDLCMIRASGGGGITDKAIDLDFASMPNDPHESREVDPQTRGSNLFIR